MLFFFDKLITRCIHNPKFTNRCDKKKFRYLFSRVFQKLVKYSAYTLQEIKEIDRHFHYLTPKEISIVAQEILPQQWDTKYLRSYLHSYQVCQLSLGSEEERVIGILQTINNSQKHPERNHLFSPLIFDFEHSFHPNLRKKKLKNSSLICIMVEEDCPNY